MVKLVSGQVQDRIVLACPALSKSAHPGTASSLDLLEEEPPWTGRHYHGVVTAAHLGI
jgi:hypothetical protein